MILSVRKYDSMLSFRSATIKCAKSPPSGYLPLVVLNGFALKSVLSNLHTQKKANLDLQFYARFLRTGTSKTNKNNEQRLPDLLSPSISC